MLEYQIQPNSRRCCVSGRELKPGDTFYSVLLDQDGQFVRCEYSEEAWQNPPENVFSFWSGVVPTSDKEKKPPIDDDLLMDCLVRLEKEQETAKIHFRYVLALLMMRRKRLKFEETKTDQGQEFMILRDARTKELYEVVHPDLSEEEMLAVQDEVLKVLGW